MTRYSLYAVKDNLYDAILNWNSDLPMNVPIMFVKFKGGRIGFKRIKKSKSQKEE